MQSFGTPICLQPDPNALMLQFCNVCASPILDTKPMRSTRLHKPLLHVNRRDQLLEQRAEDL